ncbi:MAG: c-type cytochrome [Gammaproteobacteria bacterium]|nr:c-type cytochrome [Gammaproteobacteria bacterium]MDP6617222.1 c-type cytochrome [Gammaproteobacteria bacterium]MDP6695809.1 c-type cytochrome [Gammaproteobacteria bacterium]
MSLKLPTRICVTFLLPVTVFVSGKAYAQDPVYPAQELYRRHCAACHGPGGMGGAGIPNLTDNAWQYGGQTADIERSISHGRRPVMPALGRALGDTGLGQVVSYVLSLGRPVDAPPESLKAGKELYAVFCASCHGVDGTGTPALGAPDLTDDTWLYGSTAGVIRDVVANGRANEMPAFGETLSPAEIAALTDFVQRFMSNPSR